MRNPPRMWLVGVVAIAVATVTLAFVGIRLRVARDTRARLNTLKQWSGSVDYSCHYGQFPNGEWSYGDGNPSVNGVRRESPWPQWAIDRLGLEFFHDVVYLRVGSSANQNRPVPPREAEEFWNTVAPFSRVGGLVFDYDSKKSVAAMRRFSGAAMRYIHYYDCEITAEELDVVATWRGVQSLDFPAALLDDDEFDRLASLEDVRKLNLSGTQVTGRCCETIARWDRLRVLELRHLPLLTDAGVARLGDLPSLERIDVDRTSVGDEGLIALARLPALKEISARETNVTPEGIHEFRRRRSDLPVASIDVEVDKRNAADLLRFNSRQGP